MKADSGRLVALVAAVAVAAVVTGGAIASRQGPEAGGDAAAPLIGGTAPATPPASPSTPPVSGTATPKPSTSAPTAKVAPVKIKLTLADLPSGRAPQVTYLVGREVRGGAGETVKIPGSSQIVDVARHGNVVLAVLTKGAGSELLRIRSTGEIESVAGVTSLVMSEEGADAAYAGTRTNADGLARKGGKVYAETGTDGSIREVSVPDAFDVLVLAYVDKTVYFRAKDSSEATTWSLYSWVPGEPAATKVKTVPSPTAISRGGAVAGSMNVLADFGTCSALTEIASGRRLWRTCDYQLKGFTPDDRTVIGAPPSQDGYADGLSAALDATTGNLRREWSGVSFRNTVAEDDEHLLMVADDGSETKAAIIRCAISTGACELATPLSTKDLLLS
ncbi:MAG TPA: hypothetical protein VFT31_08850 [Kribbella sp.]|nr:hypothetical protein [Kribbella sp.]